jgi:hypothetical protein
LAETIYCFDTSALIHAAARAYPIEVFASFWERFSALIQAGTAIAIDEVLREIERKDDELHAWCKLHSELFTPMTEEVQISAREVVAAFPSLVDLNRGRGQADPFVVALARVRGAVVVTQEPPKPTSPRIPDACKHFAVPCINLLDFIRQLRWKF